ncbi:MAG: acetolactate synthase large subunit [Gammaproteobacteria bacterium]|nr:acetolactate synthase large subunit [Gammaproteobacteria bacterium]MDX2488169.1 acetolactate synthase large subunit [Gammaproteobacteria bacterium]
MNGAELFVRCLENEDVEYIYGIPGEENIAVMDVLLDSPIKFITTRHEQGAAFMADVQGRLTGRAGVCLATLGPGATNLITGFADANMDHAPIVGIAGQGATTRLHKESHQILDLVNLFEPISKYSTQAREPEIIPEIVRKAFKVSQAEKPGGCFIDLPENIAGAEVIGKQPLKVQSAKIPTPPESKMIQAAELISSARFPLIMAGNGVIRGNASEALVAFAEKLNIPVATTFMAKGVIPFSHELSLGAVGLQASDYVSCGFNRADVIICIGYDIVEYHPELWNYDKKPRLIHIDPSAAEVDEYYIVECGVIGDIGRALESISELATPNQENNAIHLRKTIVDVIEADADSQAFPLKPQKILWDLRQVLAPDDIVISDVGAHKMWMARMYQAERPNTCIISNGFASMGIAVPGAVAAKLENPDKTIVAVTGDAGFMMNSQEIETALRVGTAIIIIIWTDSQYGLIRWHQMRHFGRPSNIDFKNPDFIKYAESFGAKAYCIESAKDLIPTIRQAIIDNTVVIIDCPVDYSENMKLTEQLGELVCPI